MNRAERAILEAELEAAEARSRALRRALNDDTEKPTKFPTKKRKPQRDPAAMVPVVNINEARARADAAKLNIALPAPTRKP